MKIHIEAEVPDHLAKDWLQHLRDFDTAHPGCVFKVLAASPAMTTQEMRHVLEVRPGFARITTKPWPKQ